MTPLFQETGGSLQSRIEETARIVKMLAGSLDEMSQRDKKFVEQMDNAKSVSPRQLFWLRDLVEKYL